MVLLSGETTTDSYHTGIRLEVKGVITKKSNLSAWVGNIYYGYTYYLPEKLTARRFLQEYINGKTFKSKLMRHINASHRFDSVAKKQKVFENMMVKMSHLLQTSFNA